MRDNQIDRQRNGEGIRRPVPSGTDDLPPGATSHNGSIAAYFNAPAPSSEGNVLNWQVYALEALLLDSAVIVLSSLAAGVLYDLVAFHKIGGMALPLRSGLLVALLFFGLARLKASHMPFGTSPPYERVREGLSSWITAFALFLFVAFLFKNASQLSRGATTVFFVLGTAAIAWSRANGPLVAADLVRKSPLANRDVIVIGPQNDLSFVRLIANLRRTTGSFPYAVTFDDTSRAALWPDALYRVIENVVDYANHAAPGEILVCAGRLPPERLTALLDGLAVIPRSIRLVPDELTASCLRQRIITIGENVALEMQRAPLEMPQRFIKRMIDIVCSAIALAFLAPAFAGIAVAIKWDSKGPVLFRQWRTGYRGRRFRIVKFRTMTVLEDGPIVLQAQQNDCRVTRLGAWLRRMSLDELPQLFNVLMGDMSLIGPRPHAVAHDKLYGGQIVNYALRQHVRPGISGWAQVNGLRGETSTLDVMRHRVEYDLWYVRHYSLLLDLEIVARTLIEIVRQRNAY
jgi:undecaprenyl-phosphate galactose phosphotransferase/putative colanic acid biosynthesis UDP-glucose lipid carrier transferase